MNKELSALVGESIQADLSKDVKRQSEVIQKFQEYFASRFQQYVPEINQLLVTHFRQYIPQEIADPKNISLIRVVSNLYTDKSTPFISKPTFTYLPRQEELLIDPGTLYLEDFGHTAIFARELAKIPPGMDALDKFKYDSLLSAKVPLKRFAKNVGVSKIMLFAIDIDFNNLEPVLYVSQK